MKWNTYKIRINTVKLTDTDNDNSDGCEVMTIPNIDLWSRWAKKYNITLYSSFAKKVISATASRFWNQIKNV